MAVFGVLYAVAPGRLGRDGVGFGLLTTAIAVGTLDRVVTAPDERGDWHDRPMASSARSFVQRHTRLRPVPGLEHIRLHLADDPLALWHAVQVATADPDTPLPYWAFAWGGGLALGHYLRDHPEAVAGRRVVDFASGSGLVAIAALDAGAAEVRAADIDPFAAAAIGLNARANGVRVTVMGRDVLDDAPPDVDVILAGDWAYEAVLAARVLPWLRLARERGTDVLVGDPGRRYLPTGDLVELAAYAVRTTTELEDLAMREGRVYRLAPPGP
ncbi:MAG TPA: 50S ribosomal protein L11 methyltransferase [Patescibacteria group bacterium]|nr:50S ribosomal protein L11 methyltransferase [Patescibacteria group bacterium]